MTEDASPDPFAEWASVYDVVYGDHSGDVAFYRDLARRADGRVLEIGCGTGRIYLDLLDAGVDAVGVDASHAMLQRLREKAARRGLSPTVARADMRRFAFDADFDLVYLPFNAFLHNHTVDDQVATLRTVHDHLAEGGRMALDVPVIDPRVMVEPTEDRREIAHNGETYELVQQFHVPVLADQAMDVTRTLYRDGDQIAETGYRYAVVYRREMEHLLARAGFSEWSVAGDFDGDPLDADSPRMVWTARR